MHIHFLHNFYIMAVKGCSFVHLRNCIFCPLSLSVMFIVTAPLLLASLHAYVIAVIVHAHWTVPSVLHALLIVPSR